MNEFLTGARRLRWDSPDHHSSTKTAGDRKTTWIIEYLERIDVTLAPFGGRFRVHGARPEVLEGEWSLGAGLGPLDRAVARQLSLF